jgi:hypothetical protein
LIVARQTLITASVLNVSSHLSQNTRRFVRIVATYLQQIVVLLLDNGENLCYF